MQDSSAVCVCRGGGVKPDKLQNLSELLEEVSKVQNSPLVCTRGGMVTSKRPSLQRRHLVARACLLQEWQRTPENDWRF